MIRSPLAASLLVGLVLALGACVPSTSPDMQACEQPAVELELTLQADELEPGAPSVCRDQEVTLLVASEIDGVLHIHGYDSEVPAFEVTAGETTEISFTAGRSGQFPIELHPADAPQGIGVGVFTVHEP